MLNLETDLYSKLHFSANILGALVYDPAKVRIIEIDNGVIPINLIEGVVRFDPSLKPHALRECKALTQSHIRLRGAWACNAVVIVWIRPRHITIGIGEPSKHAGIEPP